MKTLLIGIWWDKRIIQTRPTNLGPDPDFCAKEIRKHAELTFLPDVVIYIQDRGGGPKREYEWTKLRGDYGGR